jgi:hypothetical protein
MNNGNMRDKHKSELAADLQQWQIEFKVAASAKLDDSPAACRIRTHRLQHSAHSTPLTGRTRAPLAGPAHSSQSSLHGSGLDPFT